MIDLSTAQRQEEEHQQQLQPCPMRIRRRGNDSFTSTLSLLLLCITLLCSLSLSSLPLHSSPHPRSSSPLLFVRAQYAFLVPASCPSTDRYDQNSLSCASCGSGAVVDPANRDRCVCSSSVAIRTVSPTDDTSIACNVTSCFSQGLAALRDQSACVPCSGNATLGASTLDCTCSGNQRIGE